MNDNNNKLINVINKNKIISFFKSPLLYVLLLCGIIQKIIYHYTVGYSLCPDSGGYLNYSRNIFLGEVSEFRTPIYPYFIKIIKKLFGEEKLYTNIVFAQYIIFFISIIFFYLAAKKICKSKLLTSIATIIYGTSPYIFLWNNLILTECLSVVSITILLYMTISYLVKPNRFFSYFIGIYLFGMIMIRPAFIYVAAIYLVFWIIRFFTNKSEKKYNITGTLSTIVCFVLVLIYCFMIKAQFNKFELTDVSLINKLTCVVESGTFSGGQNDEITNVITKELKDNVTYESYFSATQKVIANFSREDISKYCSNVYKNKTKEYLFYIVGNTFGLVNQNIGTRYAEYTLDYSSMKYKAISFYEMLILPINFIHLYIILAISIMILIVYLFKNKKILWILAFLLSMIAGNLFTTIVGSPGEYRRLFVTSLPFTIMLLVYLVSIVVKSIDYKKLNDKMLDIN